jgi:hypothetical protein
VTARERLRKLADEIENDHHECLPRDCGRARTTVADLRTLARRIDEETLAADMMLAANAEGAQWVRNLLGRLDADLEGDAR